MSIDSAKWAKRTGLEVGLTGTHSHRNLLDKNETDT